MSLSASLEKAFKAVLPTPFSIAVILTMITMALALSLTGSEATGASRIQEVLGFWEQGLWNAPLMVFAMQMMLMLVLGHALALTAPIDRIISTATRFCSSTAHAAAIVTLLTVLVALFNWGLGLIFGAILARKVGEHAVRNRIELNYPLVAAAGYSGLMVWHGGISGSAPIKVAEQGHITSMMSTILRPEQLELLPDPISFSETIFGTMNLAATLLLVTVLPLFMFIMGRAYSKGDQFPILETKTESIESDINGAEHLDHSKVFGIVIGSIVTAYCLFLAVSTFSSAAFGFITPNFINLLLLGLGILLHQNIFNFLNAIDSAIGGASGILIQFPLYFGIMGIMNGSGLVHIFSDFFVSVSSRESFPVFTLISASIVNIFVPSGGGQWSVQGPMVIQAAMELGANIPKSIMALAYGDQLTNMLQPFWALPLLGITGLKAKEILPYSLALMIVGSVIFLSVLILF
jgi:short-chain fatty acids transporter